MVDARERSGAAALRRSFTLIPDFGARNGVWDDMSPASGRNGRCGATALRGRLPFTQNPISERELGLERQGEPCAVDAMEEAELRPYEGRVPRPPISERGAGSGTT